MRSCIALSIYFFATFLRAAHIPNEQEFNVRDQENRQTCTPVGGDDPLADDAPAIASAIAQCANGGTITIPAGKTYTVRSPLNFAGCAGCELQVEGSLLVSNTTTGKGWAQSPAIISINGISGLRVTSTGRGAIAYAEYLNFTNRYSPPPLFGIASSSNIAISNMKLQTSQGVVITADKSSTSLSFSDLNLDMNESNRTYTTQETGGIFSAAKHITISNLRISTTGYCIKLTGGTADVTGTGIVCTSAGLRADRNFGVIVTEAGLNAGTNETIQDIYFSGLDISVCSRATGIIQPAPYGQLGTGTFRNLTWNDVTVSDCWWAAVIDTQCPGCCSLPCSRNPGDPTISNIAFNDYKGVAGFSHNGASSVIANLFCPPSQCREVYLRDWNVTPANGKLPGIFECYKVANDPGVTCKNPYAPARRNLVRT